MSCNRKLFLIRYHIQREANNSPTVICGLGLFQLADLVFSRLFVTCDGIFCGVNFSAGCYSSKLQLVPRGERLGAKESHCKKKEL